MRCRWQAVRGRQLAFLLVLVIFVFGGNTFVIWDWYDTGMDRVYAEDVRFSELTRLVQ